MPDLSGPARDGLLERIAYLPREARALDRPSIEPDACGEEAEAPGYLRMSNRRMELCIVARTSLIKTTHTCPPERGLNP